MALLYLPYREIGVITNDSKFCISRLGNENFLTVSIGQSFQVMKVDKLSTCLISKPCDDEIIHIATKNNITYVATKKNKIIKFKRANIECELGIHKAHVSSLHCIGDVLLSTDVDGNINVFDTKRNSLLNSMKCLNGKQLKVAAHPPTYLNKFIFGLSDGQLELWNIRTGKHLYSFQSHWACLSEAERQIPSDCTITCLVAAPAVDVMAVGMQNGHIFLLQLKQDSVLFHFKQVGPVTDLSFRTDAAADKNPFLVSASSHGHLYTWQVGGHRNNNGESKASKLIHTLKRAHNGRIVSAQFLYGEPLLVTAGSDNCISVWIFDSGNSSVGNNDSFGVAGGGPRLLRQRQGHTQQAAHVSFFGDASYDAQFGHGVSGSGLATGLMSCDGHGSLRFTRLDKYGLVDKFSAANIEKSELLRGRPLPPAIQYDTCFLGSSGHTWGDCVTVHKRFPHACLWRVQDRAATGKLLSVPATYVRGEGEGVDCSTVCLSVCGHFAVVGYENGWVLKFNVQSGLFRGSYPKEQLAGHTNLINAQAASQPQLSISHNAPIVGVFVDVTNTVLVSASSDGRLCFWDFNSQRLLKTETLACGVSRVCGQRDTNFLAIVSSGNVDAPIGSVHGGDTSAGIVRVYDVSALRLMRVFVLPGTSKVTAVSFSPDGRRILTACNARHLRVWDLATGRCLSWVRLQNVVNSLCFSPSGDLVLGRDGEKGVLLAADRSLTESVNIDREPTQPIDTDLVCGNQLLMIDDGDYEHIDSVDSGKELLMLTDKSDAVDELDMKSIDVRFSSVPKAYWTKIFRFETFRKKKNIIAPVKKISTPFFLQGSTETEKLAGDSADKKFQFPSSSGTAISKISRHRFHEFTSGRLSKFLAKDIKSKDLLQYLMNLSPSDVEAEFRLLCPYEGQSLSLQRLCTLLFHFGNLIGQRQAFELLQAYLHCLLTVHGGKLMKCFSMHSNMSRLSAEMRLSRDRLHALIHTCLCLIKVQLDIQLL